nr:hypothetical protein Iba_chr05bCG5210 [Ipomoea batatas]GME09939.1 hypothetical protein Iba_scaffold9224CG0090 [Ipomoea batatas]
MPQSSCNIFNWSVQKRRHTSWSQHIICAPLSTLSIQTPSKSKECATICYHCTVPTSTCNALDVTSQNFRCWSS